MATEAQRERRRLRRRRARVARRKLLSMGQRGGAIGAALPSAMRAKLKRLRNRRGGGQVQRTIVTNVEAPIARGMISTREVDPVHRCSFFEHLGTFEVDALTAGQPVLVQQLAPQLFKGTHIGNLAQAYEKYRFEQLVVHVKSDMASTTSGGYVVGISPDPTDIPLIAGEQSIKFVTALNGSKTANWWLSSSATTQTNPSQLRLKWFLTGAEDEIDATVQAVGIVICNVPVGNVTGHAYIQFMVSGVCAFTSPKTENEPATENAFLLKAGLKCEVGPAKQQDVGAMHTNNPWCDPIWRGVWDWGTRKNYYQLLPAITFTGAGTLKTATAMTLGHNADGVLLFYDTLEHAKEWTDTGLVSGDANGDFALPTDTAIVDLGPRDSGAEVDVLSHRIARLQLRACRNARSRQDAIDTMLMLNKREMGL